MPAPSISMTWPQYLRSECTVDGKVYHLCGQEREILFMLLLHRRVANEDMIEHLWPDADKQPLTPLWIFRKIKCQLNQRLGPVIRNCYGFGMELIT